MSVRETTDRLRTDVQYLRDLAYLNGGGDVTLRGPSLAALIERLALTLSELQAMGSISDADFEARMQAVRQRSDAAQAQLTAQAQAASEADKSLNKAPGGQPADPTTGETPQ